MNDFDKAIAQVFEWVGDWVYQGCEVLFEELDAFALEVEAAADSCLEPILSWLDEAEAAIDHASHPLTQTISPVLQDHPACVGCCHYHGETYGGHRLICAMHPYGVEERSCPDWESVWS